MISEFIITMLLAILGILISALGSYFSYLAFTAAKQAGIAVKKRTTIDDINLISSLCNLDEAIELGQAIAITNEITAKVSSILATHNDDFDSNQDLLQNIESSLSSVRASVNTLNPLTPENGAELNGENNAVYFTLQPQLTELILYINRLKGLFENQIIKNN